MFRLLAIVLAAGPLAAAAQTITFSPDAVINGPECASTSTTTLQLAWTVTVPGAVFTTGGSYAVYASNKDFGVTAPYCYTANDTAAGTYAEKLTTDPVTVGASSQTVTSVDVNTRDVTKAANMTACATDAPIYVCVQWLDSLGAVKGYAHGTLQLTVKAPNAPTVAFVWPGDKALVVNLTDNGGAAVATTWQAKAVNVADANDVHTSSWSGSLTDIRIEGLVNGTAYTVTALARSDALNVSPESAAYGASVKPQPVRDDWQHYKDLNGRDSGGCATGPAGLLALLGAAALLRLGRRS